MQYAATLIWIYVACGAEWLKARITRARAIGLGVGVSVLVASTALAATQYQPYFPSLQMLGLGVTPSTGAAPYYSSATTATTAPTTSWGRGAWNLADAAAARAYLDVEPGVDVLAYDADVAAIAALSPTANDLLVYDGGWTLLAGGSPGDVITYGSPPAWAAPAAGVTDLQGAYDGGQTIEIDAADLLIDGPGGFRIGSAVTEVGGFEVHSDADITLDAVGGADVYLAATDITLDGNVVLPDLGANGLLAYTGTGLVARELANDGGAGWTFWTNVDGVAGNPTLALDNDLDALGANSTDGFWAHIANNTGAARTLSESTTTLGITNPAGIAGNPTFTVDADVESLAANSTNGLWSAAAGVARTLVESTTTLGIGDGDGAAGNPTFTVDADVESLAANSTDGFWAHTGAGTGAARTLQDITGVLAWTNPAGIAGNPTPDLDATIDALALGNALDLLLFPQSTAPSQTAEGSVFWDTNDDLLTVADGTNTLRLAPYQELITGTGTWTAPSYLRGSSLALVECWGPGGGGASGRRGAAATIRSGGGGGGAGGYAFARSGVVSDYTGLTVTIGAVGGAGAARTSDDTNGADGGNGGTTSWGSLVLAGGGIGGSGGTGSNSTSVSPPGYPAPFTLRGGTSAFAAPTNGKLAGAGGMPSTITSSANTDAGIGFAGVAGGGGSGSGRTAADATVGSGAGGGAWTGTAGPVGTSGDGTNGTAGDPREGGSGGGFGLTVAAGTGGAGGTYGGGGGGGGASLNGFNSGAGAVGGTGACRITVYQMLWLLVTGVRLPTRSRSRRAA